MVRNNGPPRVRDRGGRFFRPRACAAHMINLDFVQSVSAGIRIYIIYIHWGRGGHKISPLFENFEILKWTGLEATGEGVNYSAGARDLKYLSKYLLSNPISYGPKVVRSRKS